MAKNGEFQRRGTRISKDGKTVLVTLRVERRGYEFARAWASVHAKADPNGTAEEQLEGYLGMALATCISKTGWKPPEEIAALFATEERAGNPQNPLDDGVPY
ncbi:hypothetical protein [Amaricoccus solimangrovi]|uniref:Uncharacterized protein n=1 Tax=Amaricoccus solimangrovi TaxID=2589815 RepID=A0A501WGR0_9RHOB|nr:hypothetical protein [Amaricoccus solimangrovi]TPE48558.1 hypothetical protein FJM51_17600 [Amaricoccus solimangrovi]